MYKKVLILLFTMIAVSLVACASVNDSGTASNDSNSASHSSSNDSKNDGNNSNTQNMDELAEDLLDIIKKATEDGYILKDTTGNVTAEKLTLDEFNKFRESYKNQILDDIEANPDSYKISEEDGKTVCKYNFEKTINKLGIGTHMGVLGNEENKTINDDGIKTYTFEN